MSLDEQFNDFNFKVLFISFHFSGEPKIFTDSWKTLGFIRISQRTSLHLAAHALRWKLTCCCSCRPPRLYANVFSVLLFIILPRDVTRQVIIKNIPCLYSIYVNLYEETYMTYKFHEYVFAFYLRCWYASEMWFWLVCLYSPELLYEPNYWLVDNIAPWLTDCSIWLSP